MNITVREYGNTVMVNASLVDSSGGEIMDAISKSLEEGMEEMREVLRICGDAEFIDPLKMIEAPMIDVLGRTRAFGLYGRFASANYDKLEKHFACHKQHEPNDLTLEYINDVIERYVQQQRYRDDEYDDD